MPIAYHFLETSSPAGTLMLACSEAALVELSFRSRSTLHKTFAESCEDEERLRPYTTQVREFLDGKRRDFDFPLDLRGTDFQLRCWNQLLKIPYGEVITYAQLAQRVGSPNGFRAVGHANGQNPVAIIVPCHRVIASDGTLGGYGGGLPMKQWLLDLEGAVVPAQRQMSAFA